MKRLYSLKVCLAALVLILATTSSSFALIDGDIDGDGFVRMDDALLVLRYVVGTQACYGGIYLDNINVNISCPELVYACGAVTREFNPNYYGCDIPDIVLILGRVQGLI